MADQDERHQHPHRRATLMPESFRNAGDHRASMMSESCRNSGDRYRRATMIPDMYRKSNERDHSVSLMPESRRNHFDDLRSYVLLRKDTKAICRIRCSKPSIAFPENWDISKFVKEVDVPSGLLSILIHPASVDDRQKAEWKTFMSYLKKSKKAAFANTGNGILYIMPPLPNEEFSYAVVKYLTQHQHTVTRTQTHFQTERPGCHSVESQPVMPRIETCTRSVSSAKETCSRSVTNAKAKSRPNEETGERSKTRLEDSGMGGVSRNGYTGDNLESRAENGKRSVSSPKGQTRPKKNYLCTNPSYLKTLGQTHSDWIFGAIAEFVDNSRDANATRLDISINMIYSHIAGQEIPMLEVVDDGHGMGHEDIFRMIAFGRKQSDTNDPSYIGTYGHGFKTATMKLGKDALVLTQTTNSRSVAFLSQSLNEGKDIVEIPIVTYTRIGQYMKLDTKIQSEASAKNNLKAIMEFSPFDEYFIGEKAGLLEKMGTGTHIYVWNLEKRGSEYSLEWDKGTIGGSTFHQGDIFIRSRRAISRLGQMTRQVSLDYSLRSFMEVIFLDPRIKITVQGSLVKSRPLAKCLHMTSIENGVVSGKTVQVFLGRSQVDFENGNCGIFVYWHGRLIEAYKRVGSMLHNGEKTHGVIGVIDVTDVMDDGGDTFLVHSNKQGFVDCEPYTLLENWLSEKADEYLVQTKYWKKRRYRHLKPDNEWLQCDKCRKWRMLPSDFSSQKLPQEWFCYMRPINGNCEMPEENLPDEVINLSSEQNEELPENIHDVETVQVNRRGPKRQCRKSWHFTCKYKD